MMFKKLLFLCLVGLVIMPVFKNTIAHSVGETDSRKKSTNLTYNWDRVKVVGGGFITGIVYNPSEKDLVFARTDIGGAYRYNPEEKKWSQMLDFIGYDEWNLLGVESLATDPVETNRVYVAAGTYTNHWTDQNGVILRSLDKGNTWQRTELPIKLGGNMPARSMGERLAIDPNNNKVLYLGARSGNGLWRSKDYGQTWTKIRAFSETGNFVDYLNDTVGITWITFDPTTGSKGETTQTIYVGVADTKKSIYRSKDGGNTWEAVPNQPTQSFLPNHGILSSNGNLYITYTEEVGPYNGGKGSVWKYNTKTGAWTDVTPIGAGNTENPYGGIAVDPQNPNTLMVATMNKWWPDEFIYRSTDGGATWKSLWTLDWSKTPNRVNNYSIEYSISPWLDWGDKKSPDASPKLGWMIGDMEIDPFNSDRLLYGTGATLYGSDNISAIDKGEKVQISVMADGIEEASVRGLISPPSGASLFSSLVDIGGFRHGDLTKSPEMLTTPNLDTSTDIDYAEKNPNIIVRVGNADGANPRMAVSKDNGKSWGPATNAWKSSTGDKTNGGYVAVGADGRTILWSPASAKTTISRPVSYSTDSGKTWKLSSGLPQGARISSDRVNPMKFYAISNGVFYVSIDSGVTFTKSTAEGLPKQLTSNFKAMPNVEGDIWIAAGVDNVRGKTGFGLWHSTDSGKSFKKLDNVQEAATIGFGKAAPGFTYMSMYTYAKIKDKYGIYRSDDGGANWIRINDDKHQFGAANKAITGDPRVYGRVYVGTNGMGIVMGELK